MFGYACDETPQLMPLPIHLAHRLVERQAELRHNGRLPWLRPDAKSQVTVRYEGGRAVEIDTVVLSTQHAPEIEHKALTEAVIEEIIKPVLPKDLVSKKIKYLVNPTGRFVVGGPKGDTRPHRAARSSWTPTAARRRTAAARSPARIRRRWTAPPPMPRATSRRTSSPRGSRAAAWCRCRMRSASRARPA